MSLPTIPACQASGLPGTLGYGIPLAGPLAWGRRWLTGPWGATHPSSSSRAGKVSRASCVLWKATSLVPRLSPLCRSISEWVQIPTPSLTSFAGPQAKSLVFSLGEEGNRLQHPGLIVGSEVALGQAPAWAGADCPGAQLTVDGEEIPSPLSLSFLLYEMGI